MTAISIQKYKFYLNFYCVRREQKWPKVHNFPIRVLKSDINIMPITVETVTKVFEWAKWFTLNHTLRCFVFTRQLPLVMHYHFPWSSYPIFNPCLSNSPINCCSWFTDLLKRTMWSASLRQLKCSSPTSVLSL